MRPALALLAVIGQPLAAAADPRCASIGAPSYSATRITSVANGPPVTAQVFFAGPRIRIEAAGPPPGRMVTLITPDLSAVFMTTATPQIALRMPTPPRPVLPAEAQRRREERGAGRVTFITEARGASGQWHEVQRTTCRADGVLLEARHWQPDPGGGTAVTTRQTDIRLATLDPALFRLPDGFRLTDPPAMARR